MYEKMNIEFNINARNLSHSPGFADKQVLKEKKLDKLKKFVLLSVRNIYGKPVEKTKSGRKMK